MGLENVLRSGVAAINTATRSLQTVVMFQQMISDDESGDPVGYADPVPLHVCLDWRTVHQRTQSGEITVIKPNIICVDIPELAAATAGKGLTDNDIVTLPDGTTGPILAKSGYVDPGTGQPFATEATLG